MEGDEFLSEGTRSLKKRIGKLVFQTNSDILDLQNGYRRVNASVGALTKREIELEKSLRKKKEALHDAVKSLEARTGYIKEEKMEKFVLMMKTTVDTADKLLAGKSEANDVIDQNKVEEIQKEAKTSVEEIEVNEKETLREIQGLSTTLSNLVQQDVNVDIEEEASVGDEIEQELSLLDNYLRERYRKIEKEIKRS